MFVAFTAIDVYFFQAIRVIASDWQPFYRKMTYGTYWSISGIIIILIFAYMFKPEWFGNQARLWIFTAYFVFIVPKILGIIFLLGDDIRRLVSWMSEKFSSAPEPIPANGISRSEFLAKGALITAAIPFATINFGILSGAHDYKVRRKVVYLPNLPATFDGVRVAQLSDIHSGSFFNKTAVKGGVEMLLNEKPDLIFFTGDLVNESSEEVKDYIDVFDKLKAPLGVFSTLGNHDYGDYRQWKSEEAKKRNFQDLISAHKQMGWDLLMNENRIITADGEQLAILGIENWGAGRFSKYGKFEEAYKGVEDISTKLMLSHDPSSWDAKIRTEYPDIDLTFSGHTHGFQFGVEIGNFKWSPSQYIYKQWAGLYQEGSQYLYVNRGYGYIGYPGRIGILPEITIIELKKA